MSDINKVTLITFFFFILPVIITTYALTPTTKSTSPTVIPYYQTSILAPVSLPEPLKLKPTKLSKSAINSSLEHQYKLPSGILAAIHQKETSGRCTVVSKAGATGCFQLMEVTIQDIKQRFNYTFDPTNYEQSAKAAAMKLAYLAKRFKTNYKTNHTTTWSLALAAYNAGYTNVVKLGWAKKAAISTKPVHTYITFKETKNYVHTISKQVL